MQRNISISAVRIIATFFILVCHVIKFYSFIPGHAYLGHFFNVGVQMFIIISAYLYGKKYRGGVTKLDYKKFFLGRFVRVCLPCQLWALIISVLTLEHYATNHIMVLLNIQGLSWIIKDQGIPDGGPYLSHSWFVSVILICYFMIPAFIKLKSRVRWFHMAMMYIAASLLTFIHINILLISFFFLVFWLIDNKFEFEKLNISYYFIMAIMSLVIRLSGHRLFDDSILYNDIIVGITHQTLAFSIVGLLMVSISRFKVLQLFFEKKVLLCIDKRSFSVYIVHYCIISPIYSYFPLAISTFLFLAGVIIFSPFLDYLTSRINSLINRLAFRNSIGP